MDLPYCHSRRDVEPAKGLYFCAHPRMHVQNQLVTPSICGLCSFWQQPPPEQFREMPRGPLIRDQPCTHLGEQIDLRECPTCRGNVRIKVFACLHPSHQETTLDSCRTCPDYELPSSASGIGDWPLQALWLRLYDMATTPSRNHARSRKRARGMP